MSVATEPHFPSHLLSTKSIADGRDTFVFRESPSKVSGICLVAGEYCLSTHSLLLAKLHIEYHLPTGFNSSAISITAAQIYRWFRVLGCHRNCTLYHAEVIDGAPLRYYISSVGPGIPSDSMDKLEPGDYFWSAQGRPELSSCCE